MQLNITGPNSNKVFTNLFIHMGVDPKFPTKQKKELHVCPLYNPVSKGLKSEEK